MRHVQEHFPLTRSDRYEFVFRFKIKAPAGLSCDSLWADVRDPEAKVPLFDSDTLFLQVNVMKRGVSEKRKKKKKKKSTRRKPVITTTTTTTGTATTSEQKTSPKSFGSRLFGSTKLFLRKAHSIAKDGVKLAKEHVKKLSDSTLRVGEYEVSTIRKLADGGFSQVHLCEAKGRKYALKIMITDREEESFEIIKKELRVHAKLTKLKNRFIVPLIASSMHQSKSVPGRIEVRMLMPLLKQGTLFDVLIKARQNTKKKRWLFSENQALRLFLCICDAVRAMHKSGYVHRDLKTANVMLLSSSSACLTDFGSASSSKSFTVKTRRQAHNIQESASTHCSEAYRAPELFEVSTDIKFDPKKCDVFSLGCVLYAMEFGLSPFEMQEGGNVKMAVLNGRIPWDIETHCFSPEYHSLVKKALRVDPSKRSSLKTLIRDVKSLLDQTSSS